MIYSFISLLLNGEQFLTCPCPIVPLNERLGFCYIIPIFPWIFAPNASVILVCSTYATNASQEFPITP